MLVKRQQEQVIQFLNANYFQSQRITKIARSAPVRKL
jgi:hypothetical protein